MSRTARWDPCVAHSGEGAREFLGEYLSQSERNVLVVGGAGFDPRSCYVAEVVAGAVDSARGLFIRENRPVRTLDQVSRAEANAGTLMEVLPRSSVVSIDIFEGESAVVGGRNVVAMLDAQSLSDVTDVVVDVSALSVGTSFPIVRYLWEGSLSGTTPRNVHLCVTHDPKVDVSIRSVPGDTISYVHGFKGGLTLSGTGSAARLWLPQLATGRAATLRRLYSDLKPHDVCPVLPFPASDPRIGDKLIEEYMVELEDMWAVDARNFVYANEADPLDLYRTILELDDQRGPVFSETGGTILVLTVVGNKVMAIGALMAALERDLPVLHLEPDGYETAADVRGADDAQRLMHVWLEGEAYPHGRPSIMARGNVQ